MANLRTSLELEFRLLESHIIKKQIAKFRENKPDIPQYKEAINKEIKRVERNEFLFFYGWTSFFILAVIGIGVYLYLYTDLVNKADIETNNKLLNYPKYVQCIDSMQIDKTELNLDVSLTLDATISSICERSLNYSSIEDLRDTPITNDQIIDNCFYNKIDKNKNSSPNDEESLGFYSQCVKISEGSSKFTNFFYRDYSNKKFRTFIQSLENTKNFNSMT